MNIAYPNISACYAFQQAAYYSHSDVVRYFLLDGRTNPLASLGQAFKLILNKSEL